MTTETINIDYEDIYDYITHIMREPYNTLLDLYSDIDKYANERAIAYGSRAVHYDNPLGCRVQTSGGRTEADLVADMVDYESIIYCDRMRHFSAEMLLRIHIENSGLNYRERRIIELRHLTYPCVSFAEIARRIGYYNEGGVHKTYKRAITKMSEFAVKNGYYYEVFPS